LQKPYKKLLNGGRAERVGSKNQQRAECQDSAQHQPGDFLSREFCHRPKADCDKSTDGCALPKLEHREMKTLPTE
jgi:hypothetical protein